MPVAAILAPSIEESDGMVAILTDITKMPNRVRSHIQRRVPSFQMKYSKTVQREYFANVCPRCHTLSGDFFLHTEPEAPFFPKTEEQAKRLYLAELPIDEPVGFDASFHVGIGELILKNTKKIA